ncbi:MAG: DUF885 family protein, partial [Acidobacteria bacterium]|nr:DUF885 family protein [Acidobacteriota bacterium]
MSIRPLRNAFVPLLSLAVLTLCSVTGITGWAAGTYNDLLGVYREFRALATPDVRDGVPDYTPAAMARQAQSLAALRARLDAIDDSAWPVSQRVDYMIVLAEMRGLEFQHRVIRPWERDPAFYSPTNLGFGPKMHGAFGVPELPLDAERVPILKAQLEAVPSVYAQARANLTDARGDLARLGIVQKRIERNVFNRLAQAAAQHHPELVAAAEAARDASAGFMTWLESIEATRPAHGGVSKDEYNWFLRNVMLFPYSWDELLTIGEREWQRSMVFLKLEEHRHRGIPMI